MSFTNFCSIFQVYPSHLRQLEIRGILPTRKYRQPISKDYAQAFITWWKQSRGDLPTDAISELKSCGLI